MRSKMVLFRSLALMALDAIASGVSILLAIIFRFEGTGLVFIYLSRFWWLSLLSLIVRLVVMRGYGIYYWAWHYAGINEAMALIKAIVLASLVFSAMVLATTRGDFPISILVMDWMISLLLLSGIRIGIRLIRDIRAMARITPTPSIKNILIIGAGDAGEMISKEMLRNPQLGYKPVVFVDDNLNKRGQFIHQIPVRGSTGEIPSLVNEFKIAEIILAIPSANGRRVREIIEICKKTRASFKIVPSVNELINETVSLKQLREVQIEDLLGREMVKLDMIGVASYLLNKKVLVTGAGGSIGGELCRQISIFHPSELILFGKGEYSIFNIENELVKNFPDLPIKVIIGDVKDTNRVEQVLRESLPSVIFHAAAHKHVTLMEKNPEEAVKNNIVGTGILIDAADKYRVDKFIMISTDKAVKPSSIMGSTKRIAELLVQSKAALASHTQFIVVRFGNVLGSRGSVVPLFKQQIAEGGPVTVTHPDVKRYFMTIPEAVQLVIQAGALGSGGEIFILDMGEPVKILNLAQDLIKLSGLEVGKDIKIEFTGLKPGEKLFEEILTESEGASMTKHKKIFVVKPKKIDRDKLEKDFDLLSCLAFNNDSVEVKNKIKDILLMHDYCL